MQIFPHAAPVLTTHTHSSASPIRSSLCSSQQLRLMCLSPRCVCQCFIQISLNPTNSKGGEKQPPSSRLHVSGAFSPKKQASSNKLTEKRINSTLLNIKVLYWHWWFHEEALISWNLSIAQKVLYSKKKVLQIIKIFSIVRKKYIF